MSHCLPGYRYCPSATVTQFSPSKSGLSYDLDEGEWSWDPKAICKGSYGGSTIWGNTDPDWMAPRETVRNCFCLLFVVVVLAVTLFNFCLPFPQLFLLLAVCVYVRIILRTPQLSATSGAITAGWRSRPGSATLEINL